MGSMFVRLRKAFLISMGVALAFWHVPAHADAFPMWQKITTDQGCIAYIYDYNDAEEPGNWRVYHWTGRCSAGAAINGQGSLQTHFMEYGEASVSVQTGQMIGGYFEGNVTDAFHLADAQGRWDSSRPEDALRANQYVRGCRTVNGGLCDSERGEMVSAAVYSQPRFREIRDSGTTGKAVAGTSSGNPPKIVAAPAAIAGKSDSTALTPAEINQIANVTCARENMIAQEMLGSLGMPWAQMRPTAEAEFRQDIPAAQVEKLLFDTQENIRLYYDDIAGKVNDYKVCLYKNKLSVTAARRMAGTAPAQALATPNVATSNGLFTSDAQSVFAAFGRLGQSMAWGTASSTGPVMKQANNQYEVYFYECTNGGPCSGMQLKACYAYPNASMAKANDWNRTKLHSRVYMAASGNICIDRYVDFNGGAMEEQQLRKIFDTYIGTLNAGIQFNTP